MELWYEWGWGWERGQLIIGRAHSVALNRKRAADTADWQGDNLLS